MSNVVKQTLKVEKFVEIFYDEENAATSATDPEAAEAAALLAEILEDEAEETGTH